jgi:hypothetical protein
MSREINHPPIGAIAGCDGEKFNFAYIDIYGNVRSALTAFRSSDETFQPVRIDRATNSLQIIDYAHHELHSGSSFMYHDVIASLSNTIVQDYVIITPNTSRWSHIGHSVESTGPLTLQIFEGSDRTSARTLQTVFNRDRNSSIAATTMIYKNDATGASSGGTTDGTRIVWWSGGIANNKTTNGTNVGSSNEKILKRNTTYIFRITSGMDSNLISVSFDWYEHTNIA